MMRPVGCAWRAHCLLGLLLIQALATNSLDDATLLMEQQNFEQQQQQMQVANQNSQLGHEQQQAAANQWHFNQLLPSGGGGAMETAATNANNYGQATGQQGGGGQSTLTHNNNNNNNADAAAAEMMIYEPELQQQYAEQQQQQQQFERQRRGAMQHQQQQQSMQQQMQQPGRLARQQQVADYAAADMEAALAELDAAAGVNVGTSDELLQFEAAAAAAAASTNVGGALAMVRAADQQQQQQKQQMQLQQRRRLQRRERHRFARQQQKDDVGQASALISHQEAAAELERTNSMSSAANEHEQQQQQRHLEGNLEKYDASQLATMALEQNLGVNGNNAGASGPSQAANNDRQQQQAADQQQQQVAATTNASALVESTTLPSGSSQADSQTPIETSAKRRPSVSMDSRLAQFIKAHLLPSELPASEHERTDKLAQELGKLYRVLSVTTKWASSHLGRTSKSSPSTGGGGGSESIAGAGNDSTGPQMSETARMFSAGKSQIAIEADAAQQQQQQQSQPPQVSARQMSDDQQVEGGSGRQSLRRRANGLLVGRLVKKTDWNALFVKLAKVFLQYFLDMILNDMFGTTAASAAEQTLKFDPISNSYSGLTFTFDARLDKQVQERLHFDHWAAIMQQTSSLLYESLNGRAHLADVRVLIPYKWRQFGGAWPMLHKPGSPIISSRRLRYADADVLVGQEDPIYKETPFAVQHDECGRPGLNIRMPIGFLDRTIRAGQLDDSRLKARQLVREFASHRYGIFKESGFRSDFMYPPYSSVAGLPTNSNLNQTEPLLLELDYDSTPATNRTNGAEGAQLDEQLDQLRGFDQQMRECKFATSSSNGLPLPAAANCLPYLVRAPNSPTSFNLMSADPFSYATDSQPGAATGSSQQQAQARKPIQWNEQLAELVSWHFCGENFPSTTVSQVNSQQQQQQPGEAKPVVSVKVAGVHFEHNQRASNKQNKMCQERSALEVIRASEDFKRTQFSPANFNRLPAPNFKFLQEMPPRLIMCFEYTSHLFQTRRLDHAMLAAAVNKFLAFDLIADSELATIVFGQHQARQLDSSAFQRLDSSLSSRFALFNPAIDPFDEQPQLYTANELVQLGINQATNGAGEQTAALAGGHLKLLKGTCSFARLMNEVNQLLHKSSLQYDDTDADVIMLTSGLFVEDEAKIEEIIRASNFKPEVNRLELVIYPSGMLFDTKSRDGYIVLDSSDSELIIKSRISKLLLIERLTNARIHLIREQLDASGEVKMSTLMQFYQIFERLAKGHSWDQTNSVMLLSSQQVDSRQVLAANQPTSSRPQADELLEHNRPQQQQQQQQQQHKLTFQFELDDSVQNELFVGFIDPKVSQHQSHQTSHSNGNNPTKAGKRFQLKNLQLRSPGGQFVFTEVGTFWTPVISSNRTTGSELEVPSTDLSEDQHHEQPAGESSAFFPYRAQLSLAAFHIRPWHLSQLQSIQRLAGTWTLSAISDEPIQTSGLAMGRTNSQGDTLAAHCWIQTYRSDSFSDDSQQQSNAIKQVKVFAQVSGGSAVELAQGRMEVQDEMGNIVQNVQMLDDGLGAPDMTQNDGILSQYVRRATRPGFYKVMMEISMPQQRQRSNKSTLIAPSGQDNICCGSSIPKSERASSSNFARSMQVKMPTRQLYCGTFHVDQDNRLGQQRPPRISNLTAVHVDQDNRRVTLRWFEPAVEISSNSLGVTSQLLANQLAEPSQTPGNSQLISILSDNDLLSDETSDKLDQQQQQINTNSNQQTRRRTPRLSPASGHLRRQVPESGESEREDLMEQHSQQSAPLKLDNVLIATHHAVGETTGELRSTNNIVSQQLSNRYEIKLFTDRDIIKRAFDAKHEIGFKFTEWNVEGQYPNASQFGGMKEVTLRIPFAREGFYFIAMKVYNNQGLSSQMSNIVQFYLRNNLTMEEVESIYRQPGTTVDAEGNVYDKNGELIHLRSNQNQLLGSYSLLKGTSALDGLSVLVLFSLLAFIMTIMCVTLVACLANSARQSLKKKKSLVGTNGGGGGSSTSGSHKATDDHDGHQGNKQNGISSLVGPNGISGGLCGSGSSMVSQSSGCDSSDVGACSSQASANYPLQHNQQIGNFQHHQDHLDAVMQTANEMNQLAANQTSCSYNQLQQQHKLQQQQAQMIHNQLISSYQQEQAQDFYNSPIAYQQQQQQLQHTVVNGYTYATVMPSSQQQLEPVQQQQQYQPMFTGDLNQNGLGSSTPNELQATMSSHYEHVHKRDSVMRFNIEQLEGGLPQVGSKESNSPAGSSAQLPHNNPSHRQLQQQLSSVLKSKRQLQDAYDVELTKSSSPALEGVTGDLDPTFASSTSGLQLAYVSSADQMAPPPPQYVYGCAPLDTNGLGQPDITDPLARDPSIYSQTTNLQQVAPTSSSGATETNYYVNHYDNPNSSNWTQMGMGQNQMHPSIGCGRDPATISEV